jgi:peptide chain release factor
VVALVLEAIEKEARNQGLSVRIVDAVPGEFVRTFRSVLVLVDGAACDAFVSSWKGTVQWVGQSLFRPRHKRKNWFVGIEVFDPPAESEIDLRSIKIETLKAGGPGGQHVNKTDSAVRITYLPTGLSVLAREERSQFMNRKLALARLKQCIEQEHQQQQFDAMQDRWARHNQLERGNPVRVLNGPMR